MTNSSSSLRRRSRTGGHVVALVIMLLGSLSSARSLAGDDASGPIRYSVDLAHEFTTYELDARDRTFAKALANKLHYTGQIMYFVRTSLSLDVDGAAIEGSVYQAIGRPQVFYVARSDAMLKIGKPYPYSPGVGGFSMFASKSQNFLVCMNFQPGGVPFLSGSSVIKGRVTWLGHNVSRF